MSGTRSAHIAAALFSRVGLPLVLGAGQSMAQSEPATIPTVVAQAMSFEPRLLGRPQFFDGRTPPDWPAALIPPGVKIVGGGIVGDSGMFRMRTAVFEFSGPFNSHEAIEAMLARAGYVHPRSEPDRPSGGGFIGTESPSPAGNYCNGNTLATFGAVDSVHAPLVVAIYLVDGEAGRQNCAPQRERPPTQRFPVTVPPLSPPAGVVSIGAGSTYGGSGGDMTSTLRTTMPADSVLAHYSAQLTAGGWKTEGRPAIADGIGVQRFSFHEGADAWTAALIVIGAGTKCQVRLQVSRVE